MQGALFSIRAALAGASEVKERVAPPWTPVTRALLRLISYAPLRWRAAALTTLMVTALVLLYVSRSPSPFAAPTPDGTAAAVTLDQLVTYPLPAGLTAALAAQRDSALAAPEMARRAGAMKNTGPSLILAVTIQQTPKLSVRAVNRVRATLADVSAGPQNPKTLTAP